MIFSNIINVIFADPVKVRAYRVLAKQRGGLTGRGLAALVHTSPFKINRVLRELVSHGIIRVTPAGKSHLYQLNDEHVLVRELICTLIQYEDDYLQKFGLEVLKRLTPPPLSIILYGSVARGDATSTSDIDLLLLYQDSHLEHRALSPGLGHINVWVAQHYGAPASVSCLRIAEFQRRGKERDPFIRNIIKEGKSLAGLSMTEVITYDGQKDPNSHSVPQ